MQRMISHDEPLPPCAAGHTARHMLDTRALRCGGGHFFECACRQTPKFPSAGQALRQWCKDNDREMPQPVARVAMLRPGK